MRVFLTSAVALLAAGRAGAADPAPPESIADKVAPPVRYERRVQMHDVPVNFRTPEDLKREEKRNLESAHERKPNDLFSEEPVTTPPPPPREPPRARADNQGKNDDWLKVPEKRDAKKSEPSGWGWLVDESRRVGASRERKNDPLPADEEDSASLGVTNESFRASNDWAPRQAQDPVSREAVVPGLDRLGDPVTGRPLTPVDASLQRELSQRAQWLPSLDANPLGAWGTRSEDNRNAPATLGGVRNGTGRLDSSLLDPGIPSLSPAGVNPLTPIAGFTPDRVDAGAGDALAGAGSLKPLFPAPVLGPAGGAVGTPLPALTPSLSAPALNNHSLDGKPAVDGIRANTRPW